MEPQFQESHQMLPINAMGSGFLPALDGLRGIAIIGVLFFHLGIPKFSLGWAGVELFFVISGFLITRVLLNTREQPNYFRNFFYRRILRIFPIYYLVLIAYTAIVVSSSLTGFRNLPFYYVYLQTIPQLQSQFGELQMLSHTWSLAIEEQFYLIWPMAIYLLKGRKLFAMLLILIGTGLSLRFMALRSANAFLLMAGSECRWMRWRPEPWLPMRYGCLTAKASNVGPWRHFPWASQAYWSW